MARVNNEGINTQQMRDHQRRKLSSQTLPSHEETDLIMCSSVVQLGNSVALNRRSEFADLAAVMLANPDNKALVSDVDAQLILKVSFKYPVTVTSVSFRAEHPPQVNGEGADDGVEEASGPKVVKCFANLQELDFTEVSTVNPCQELSLSPHQLNGSKIPLKGTRFSRCTSVQFFLESNQDESEMTYLNRLCLWGHVSPAYHLE